MEELLRKVPVKKGVKETSEARFLELYNDSYAHVEQGICFDEVGHAAGAKVMYERSLKLIEEAEKLPGAQQNELYAKMDRARQHIRDRLAFFAQPTPKALERGTSTTTTETHTIAAGEEETVTTTTTEDFEVISYPQIPKGSPIDAISGALMAMGDVRNAEEIYSIPDGVQIFYIKGNDTTVPSYPCSLKVFRFAAEATGGPPAFLQVGDWVFPLSPGKTPVLHSTYGAYIFPEQIEDTNVSVGIILPQDLDEDAVHHFEDIMRELTVVKTEEVPVELTPEEKLRLSSRIAQFLVTGAEWLAKGINSGAIKAAKSVEKGSTSLQKDLKPSDQAMMIDPRVQNSVHYLRKGTKVAVKVSGYLVNKLGQMAVHIGKYAASHAEKRISKSSVKGASAFHDAVEVSGAALVGAATVWMSLEQAAKVLAKSIANESVKVIEHKYGPHAGNVADDAIHGAMNIGVTAWNVDNMGVKAIAKRSAKEAGFALLTDLSENKPKGVENAVSTKDTSPVPPPRKKK